MRTIVPDAPPVRGAFKVVPEDFRVEEIPAYLPKGEGDHLFLFVEKRGRTTQDVVDLLARLGGIPTSTIGYAGLKDRQGVTRQWFSIPNPKTPLPELEDPAVRILEARPHKNKLRTGHLRGNRFVIRLRGAGPQAQDVEAIFSVLEERGVPNYYGAQRFGRHGANARRGRDVLAGRLRPRRRLRRLYLSALQSELFNAWLDARIDDGLFGRVIDGDLLCRRGGHAVFAADLLEPLQARFDAGEIDVTGPIFGPRMRAPQGEAAAREAAILAAADLDAGAFRAGGKDSLGTRRSARIPLEGSEIERDGDDLILSFTLPRGAYATVVLEQFLA